MLAIKRLFKLYNVIEKSKALREAKLSYLNTCKPNEAFPYLWGSFVMVGNNSSVVNHNNLSWWIITSAGLILLLIMGVILKRKMHKK